MIRITGCAYFFLALLFLTVPLRWAISVLLAALFHEFCHYRVICFVGGNVTSVTIDIHGAVMDARIPSTERELLCAAAGPVGSFLLLLLCRMFPEIAVCGFIQGCINMLPVYPLDGGRILKCILELAEIKDVQRALLQVKRITYIAAVFFTAIFTVRFSGEKLIALLGCVWFLKRILRKRPCKQKQNGVQ